MSKYNDLKGSMTLKEMYPKINTNNDTVEKDINELQQNIDDNKQALQSHQDSIKAHDAPNITYSGATTASNVKQAIDSLQDQTNNIVTGGTEVDPRVSQALADSENENHETLKSRNDKWENRVKTVEQDLTNSQRIPFSTNGQSIKSTPPRGGNVSDVVLHGREPLVNLLGDKGSFKTDTNRDGVADGWDSYNNATNFSLNNGIQTFTPTEQHSGINLGGDALPAIEGHKYYISAIIKTSNTLTSGKIVTTDSVVGTEYTHSVNFEKISILSTASKTGDFRVYYNTGNVQNFNPLSIKEYMVIDLTACFGQGNEPDKTWCDENIPYFEDMLYPTDCEVRGEGENIFDKQKFNRNKTTFLQNYKNIIKVKPNTTYTASSNRPFTTNAGIYFNGTSTSKSGVDSTHPRTITTDSSGEVFILIRFAEDFNPDVKETTFDKIMNGEYYLQIIEGTQAPDHYIPYNSSPMYVQFSPNHPPVRLKNRAENKVVEVDGGYVEECEVKLDILQGLDIENWAYFDKDKTNTIAFYIKIPNALKNQEKIICNAFPGYEEIANVDYECCYINAFSNFILRINKTKLATLDTIGFKKWLQDNNLILLYQMTEPKTLYNGQEGFKVQDNLDTFPNGRIVTEGYYSKVYNLTDTNTITLDTELGELKSVEMYMDGTNNDKILLLLKASLTDSKTITLDKKYSGSVLVKGRPKYFMSPSLSCKISTNLGTDVHELKEDNIATNKQLISLEDKLDLLIVLNS